MNPRKLIYSGIIVLAASILTPVLIVIWTINSAFEAMRTNQTAGIGAVGDSTGIGIFGSVFGMIGLLTGLILLIVGISKAICQSKTENWTR